MGITIDERGLVGLIEDTLRRVLDEAAVRQTTEGPAPAPPLLVDAKEVARLLGISERAVFRMASAGELPGKVKMGHTARWPRKAIEEFVANEARRSEAIQQRKAAKRLDLHGIGA